MEGSAEDVAKITSLNSFSKESAIKFTSEAGIARSVERREARRSVAEGIGES